MNEIEKIYHSLDKCLEIISRLNNYVLELEEENKRLKRERLYLATKLSKALPVSAKPMGWIMIAGREANKGEEDE